MVRVAVDAMGGDYAPQEIVKGAVRAAREDGVEVILVGTQDAIREELNKYNTSSIPIRVVNATQVIREGEPPTKALRQKSDASVMVATQLVKSGGANAVVSMGSTGALMASAFITLGALEGIKRPVAGGAFLGFAPHTVVFDMGVNADCQPRQLLSFATMGRVVAQKMLNIPNPTVALLSNGAEEGKGNRLVKEAYQLFKKSNLNFIGNVEGNDIPLGRANVIVCDGFVGNILVKFCEGLSKSIIGRLKVTLDGRLSKEEIDAIGKELFALTNMADTEGGGLVYGVDGVVVVGHGRSRAPQVAGAIHSAKLAVETNLIESLKSELARMPKIGG
jgi:glycerol-3-phosphate acyltransferase PlsX